MNSGIQEVIGVQDRGPEFGDGITQRVYELQYGSMAIGVNMGDIAQAPTDAIMMPSTPWLMVGGGMIEKALRDKIGDQYDTYTAEVRACLELVSNTRNVSEKEVGVSALASLFETVGHTTRGNAELMASRLARVSTVAGILTLSNINLDLELVKLGADGNLQSVRMNALDALPREIVDELIDEIDQYETALTLPYGEAVPCTPGVLSANGIKAIIVSSVTPDGSVPGEEDGMNKNHMAMFTHNAAVVADMTGSKSLTIPAVGTGFAAHLGFGMSLGDSMRGFFSGAKRFADSNTAQFLNRLDFNIYAVPDEKNASEVASVIRTLGIMEHLQTG